MEEILPESEERYRRLVELMPDAVLAHAEGIIVYVNNACKKLFRESETNKLVGRDIRETVHKSDWELLFRQISEVRNQGKMTPLTEFRTIRLDGTMFTSEVTARLVSDQGRLLNLCIIRDITARKKAESDLKDMYNKLCDAQNYRKFLSKRMIDLTETLRGDVVMDLHDHVGQLLATLKIELEAGLCALGPADALTRGKIELALMKAREAITEIKRISSGLLPSLIINLGLVPSLKALFKDIVSLGVINIHFFEQTLSERFGAEKEIAVYRVAEEAITNVVKHAQAANVFVNLVRKEESLSFSVEDDGTGFNIAEANNLAPIGGPLGLHIMRERIVQLDGEFVIDSHAGKGTHILVELPL